MPRDSSPAIEGLAGAVTALRPIARALPWHWLIAGAPLRNGFTPENTALPIEVSVTLAAAGVVLFARRDLH